MREKPMGASNGNGKVTLSTYVEPNIAAAVRQEAKDKAVSTAAVIRWALMDRYESETQAAPEQVPARP